MIFDVDANYNYHNSPLSSTYWLLEYTKLHSFQGLVSPEYVNISGEMRKKRADPCPD